MLRRKTNGHAHCSEEIVPVHVEVDMAMSLCEQLRKDHDRTEKILERLLASFDARGRTKDGAWSEVSVTLLAHLRAEETYLAPFLERASPRSARVVAQEHRHIRARLTELGNGLDSKRSGRDDARALLDELRAHARSEERLLYRWADEHLDSMQKTMVFDALLPRASRIC